MDIFNFLPRLIWHVFREIGEQDGQTETDFSSRLVETLGECSVVNLSVVIGLAARKKEADFISKHFLRIF